MIMRAIYIHITGKLARWYTRVDIFITIDELNFKEVQKKQYESSFDYEQIRHACNVAAD